MSGAEPPPDDAVDGLARLVDEAARRLAAAGGVDAACRLAARAWWLAAPRAPGAAHRLNATLHHLTRVYEKGPHVTDQSETTLDVRSEPPAHRHQLIFDTYHALGAGQSFVLLNDHDPKPLWYQFDAEYAGRFDWEYLEEGPADWRVRIGKPAAAAE